MKWHLRILLGNQLQSLEDYKLEFGRKGINMPDEIRIIFCVIIGAIIETIFNRWRWKRKRKQYLNSKYGIESKESENND